MPPRVPIVKVPTKSKWGLVLMLTKAGILFGEMLVVGAGVMVVKAVGVMSFAYCFSKNCGAREEHFNIQLLWATARLLINVFSFIYRVDEFSLKKMKTWGQFQDFTLLLFCLV